MIQKKGLKTKIMVDGGINENTVEKVVCSGAEILVMGYGIFRSDFVSFKRKLEAIKCF